MYKLTASSRASSLRHRKGESMMNMYEKAFVIYSYDKNLHLSHLKDSDMPLKDFLKAYKVELKELTDDEVIYTP